MLKVMLVDDEDIIRNGINDNIAWAEHGFEVVAEAADGTDALEFIRCVVPDIVITDIRMRRMDGLEFVEALRKLHPDVYVVILSGYDDFAYAQRAVNSRVYKYLLKPVNAGELTEVLLSIREEIADRMASLRDINRLNREISQNMSLLREKFLSDLVGGQLPEDEAGRRGALIGLNPHNDRFVAGILEIENAPEPEDLPLTRLGMARLLQDAMGEGVEALAVSNTPRTLNCLLAYPASQTDEGELLEQLHRFHDEANRFLGVLFSVGVGRAVTSLGCTPQSVREARAALNRKLTAGNNSVIHFSDIQADSGDSAFTSDADARLIEQFKLGAFEESLGCLRALTDELRARRCTKTYICMLVMGIVNAVNRYALQLEAAEPMLTFQGFEQLGRQLDGLTTLEQIMDWLRNYLTEASERINQKRNHKRKYVVHLARAFIREHFREPELSLERVASHVSLTASYLSRALKEETGENYVSFVTTLRLEEAKRLLKASTAKAYEVGYAVGYSNPHYFSICFKQNTGMSPNDYRNSDMP